MAAVTRRPLHPRIDMPIVPAFPATRSQSSATLRRTLGGISNLKRPRSPGHSSTRNAAETSIKRLKPSVQAKEKEISERATDRRIGRTAQDDEFRTKYSKAFPSWTFFFDMPAHERSDLQQRVTSLGGVVTDFFSNEVTHLISNKPIPTSESVSNKENSTSKTKRLLRSPIKLASKGGTCIEDALIRKAVQLGMKIWDGKKLNSVLTRCGHPSQIEPLANLPTARSLTSLLECEKRLGMSTERDPTQRRHDFRYFGKNSCFVLVEDITQEHATIAAMEYPVTGRASDGKEKGDWPVPYCQSLSRGPFILFNDKEERKRAKQDKQKQEREEDRAAEALRIRQKRVQQQQKETDLRRTVSMNNLRKATNGESTEDRFSGGRLYYDASPVPSGYLAASGNSVGITSTYGTTSTLGSSARTTNGCSQMSVSIKERFQHQVTWSRRAVGPDSNLDDDRSKVADSKGSENREKSVSSMMPPPDAFPQAKIGRLRKSKSTNTVRLPKRDEKTKPGYCESCRVKFEDFKEHIRGRKHQKFAMNDGNFVELDCVLSRVKRSKLADIEECERERESARQLEHAIQRRKEFFLGDTTMTSHETSADTRHEHRKSFEECKDELMNEDDEEGDDEILLSPRKTRTTAVFE